jgi:type I site-specific restriction endonuclease
VRNSIKKEIKQLLTSIMTVEEITTKVLMCAKQKEPADFTVSALLKGINEARDNYHAKIVRAADQYNQDIEDIYTVLIDHLK